MSDNPENMDSKSETPPSPSSDTFINHPVLNEDYALNPSFVRSVIDALEQDDQEKVRRLLYPLHAADLADLLGLVSGSERRELIRLLSSDLDHDVLTELDEDIRDDVLKQLEPSVIAAAVQAMESDDAVHLVEDMPLEKRKSVLEHVPQIDRAAVEHALSYGENCAGRLMQREVLTVPPFWTVGQVIDHMRETKGLPDQFFEIYVVDESFHPIGSIPISRLMQAQRTVAITKLMDTEIHLIQASLDQEQLAYLFNQYHLLSAAVVNEDQRLVGMVTIDDIVEVIKEEDTEDILALGGVKDERLTDGVMVTTKRRFSWLLINLVSAILASIVIAFFDGTLERFVALAILMPIVASMGGNAGTQTLTVAIRAMATRDLTPSNAMRIIMREVLVGGLNGFLFAVVMGLIGGIWFQSVTIGAVLAAAMLINLLCAGAAGILVPLGIQKYGADPALASPVLVTSVTDLIGFFVFLSLGALALS